MQIKKIRFDSEVLGDQATDEDRFDADTAIVTGELIQLLDDLLTALGGQA